MREMAEFAAVVRRYMGERGMSLRGLAAAAHYDPGLLSKVLRGQRPYSEYLAARLDGALGAGGGDHRRPGGAAWPLRAAAVAPQDVRGGGGAAGRDDRRPG